MRQYEMTYLISDKVPDADINKVTGKVGGFIAELDGKIAKEEIWKRRKLAYPIKKQEYATYVTLNFELPGENAKELENQIKLSSEIIRQLLIIQNMDNKKVALTAEEIVDTAAIEKAIGGEKSFEAVEGETAESRDLQAVREKDAKKAVPEPEIEKPEKPAEAKPKARRKKAEMGEADRLAKLDEQLDNLLKEDL